MSEEREYDDTQHNEAASASTREPSDVSQRGLKASAGPRSRELRPPPSLASTLMTYRLRLARSTSLSARTPTQARKRYPNVHTNEMVGGSPVSY